MADEPVKMQKKGQLPNEEGKCYCEKQGKWMREALFFTYKDGSKSKMCKKCLTMHVDDFNPDTFKWILKDFDVPYIPSEWNTLRDRDFAKNPDKQTSVLGKYLSKMRINQFKTLGWADTQTIQAKKEAEDAKRKAEYEYESEKTVQQLKEKLAAGEISEAEYKTLMPTPIQNEQYTPPTNSDLEAAAGDPYQQDQFIDEKDLPDPAADLTDEDKIKLAVKWGRLYKPNEWIQLEKDYRQMVKDFEIDDADTKNSLILICKLNLKANQCLDRGDYDGFTKLSKELSSQRKLANFAAIGRKKDEKEDFVTSAGELVAYCQKYGGIIPKFKTDAPLDIVDKELQDQKNYLKSLIQGDPALSREIEDYIKKREIQQEQEKDQKEAEEQGLEARELTDEDFADYKDFIAGEREKDGATQIGVDTKLEPPQKGVK